MESDKSNYCNQCQCPIHACMSNDCQIEYVKESGPHIILEYAPQIKRYCPHLDVFYSVQRELRPGLLILPIKKKWFDLIIAREKSEEYREISPYYKSRFKNIFDMYPHSCIPTGLDKQQLILRNGYSRSSPSCIITASLDIKTGRPEWGAEKDKEYYVLKIHDVDVMKGGGFIESKNH